MLPTPRALVAICWTCGQPGAHGTADECIAALKHAAANILPVTPSRAVYPLVVRYVAQTRYRSVFWGTSVDEAIRWIHRRRQKRGIESRRNYYWIERAGVSATRR